MGFNIRGGDKSSLALLSSKRGRAYARTKADEAFALPTFSDAMPAPAAEPVPPRQLNGVSRPEQPAEQDAENVKQTMLQHESVFKEQLHELHRLYQKQRVLMAESKKDPSCDRSSEPPSSNSSLLCNPETFRVQEERSLGDVSVAKACESNQTYGGLLSRMNDLKHFEDCGSSRKESTHQLFGICRSGPKQSSHHVLSSERPAAKQPIIDLERPAEEYMDVEVQEEKPQIAGLTYKSAGTFPSVHGHFTGVTKARDDREVLSGDSRDSRDSKLFGFQIISNTRISESLQGGREGMLKGGWQQKELADNHSTFTEVHLAPQGPSLALAPPKEEPLLYPKESSCASGHFQGLPDLNGDTNCMEEQSSSMQAVSGEHVRKKDRQHIDIEGDSRSSTSQLPHWLCQAPLAKPSPLHVSVQTSACWPQTSVFLPQVHEKTVKNSPFLQQLHEKPNWSSNLRMETTNGSFTQEPDFPWLRGAASFGQGEFSFREPPSVFSPQLFRGENAGVDEGSYAGIHGRDYISGGIPFFYPQARDSGKVDMTTTTVNSFLNVVGSQGPFERNGPSGEPLSKVGSEVLANFSESPWYQQRESFSQLLHHASNPEPFCNRSSPVNPWEIPLNHHGPPYGFECVDRSIHGVPCHARSTECSSSLSKSTMVSRVSDPMHASPELGGMPDIDIKGSQITSCKQVETPVVSTCNRDFDLNLRENVFDLNVSSEEFMPLEDFDACNANNSSCHANHHQGLKQESETSRSTGWQALNRSKETQLHEPQRKSSLCIKAFGVSADTNTTHLHGQTFLMSETTGNLCSEGDMLRNDSSTDYCSGEDETGGPFVQVKSSDGSGLTSCESRDAVHLGLVKARDDSNTSSGDACYSRESRIPNHKEDVAFLSSLQRKKSTELPSLVDGFSEARYGSLMFPNTQGEPSQCDVKEDCSGYNCTDFDGQSEAANAGTKKDLVQAAEAAELLLSLGLDLRAMRGDDFAINDCGKCLDWLADVIPDEDYCQPKDFNVEMASGEKDEERSSTDQALEVTAAKALDPFELAVLALKPVDPNLERIATPTMDRGNGMENVPTMRRRPSRRGRSGKDFQKDVLRTIISLSRHEVTEDLQIIEGLIKSAAETMCVPCLEEKASSSPEQGSLKGCTKWKGPKPCQDRKLNETLNVCSWGESTRRKRMGRQRSQWLSLPPGVRLSLFPVNAADVP